MFNPFKLTRTCHTVMGFQREALTCRCGSVKENRVGYKDEQHRCICGDVVRDGVLKALLTTAPKCKDEIRI